VVKRFIADRWAGKMTGAGPARTHAALPEVPLPIARRDPSGYVRQAGFRTLE